MTTKADLLKDGLRCFTHVDTNKSLDTSPHFGVFKEIREALADMDFVRGHLRYLEDEMKTELLQRIPDPGRFSLRSAPDREANFRAMYPADGTKRKNPSKRYKNLFSTVMRRTEKANGFGELSYAWGVSAAAFLDNLKARRPFKDYSASPNYHGEHTHRVQWWLICRFVLPASGNNAQYYEECAYWTCRLTGEQGGDRTLYLWDYLFDSASNTTGFMAAQSAGSNPNNVYQLCRDTDKTGEYPLLSQFMRYRKAKTDAYTLAIQKSKSQNVMSQTNRLEELKLPKAILERAAQRFANMPFDRLSNDKQTALVDAILEAGFTDHDLPG